jgi:hypothetical protein
MMVIRAACLACGTQQCKHPGIFTTASRTIHVREAFARPTRIYCSFSSSMSHYVVRVECVMQHQRLSSLGQFLQPLE